MDYSILTLFLLLLAGFLIGISKTGISGAGLVAIPILAEIFGGKISTGVILPMLVFADVFAVSYYHRHANWILVFRLLPSSLTGIMVGLWLGTAISDNIFSIVLSSLVILGILLMVILDIRGKKLEVPQNKCFAIIMGFLGGFATMMANAAGPVMALYLLAMRLPKNSFIGTSAWFFFVINILKLPLQIFFWKNIGLQSLLTDLIAFPGILAGIAVGIWVVKKIPERIFRYVIIASTLIATMFLF